MSAGVVPDTTEVYINEGWEKEGIISNIKELREFLVIEKYDDCPDHANLAYEDINGVRYNDTDKIELVEALIHAEGWTLFKTLHKEWFDPKLEFFNESDLHCSSCNTVVNLEFHPKFMRWFCFQCLEGERENK